MNYSSYHDRSTFSKTTSRKKRELNGCQLDSHLLILSQLSGGEAMASKVLKK